MYRWLRKEFEYRSIAEMSIWFTITAIGSFIFIFLLWGLFTGIASGTEEKNVSNSQMFYLLIALFLWLIFLVWLWVSFVRIAWKCGHERLGIPIFRYLQIGFFVMTLFTMLVRSDLREDFKILVFMLLAFDIAIGIMIFNFLILAWFARSRIPLRSYMEIGSIILMIVVQVWVVI